MSRSNTVLLDEQSLDRYFNRSILKGGRGDRSDMHCDNCDSDAVAYTLTTYVEPDGRESVELHFCSTDCLDVWT
ncbi:hypothetical protein NJ7G_3095 [Natrinema sp. J7-2]|nr:hypothetical protein NJ7G_3095 [Natrinema sp. J7-2]